MQMLDDSSDDSESDLNLSDLDDNIIAQHLKWENATFRHQERLSLHFRQQTCTGLSVDNVCIILYCSATIS